MDMFDGIDDMNDMNSEVMRDLNSMQQAKPSAPKNSTKPQQAKEQQQSQTPRKQMSESTESFVTEDGEVMDVQADFESGIPNVVNRPVHAPQAAQMTAAERGIIVSERQQQSLVERMGQRYGIDGSKLFEALKQTCFKQYGDKEITTHQMMSLLVVAEQYNLNPFTKEIYAFPQKDGIVPVIGVDGWIRIVNNHPKYCGVKFNFSPEEVDVEDSKKKCNAWIECEISRIDFANPITVREYFDEAYLPPKPTRNGTFSGPWQSHPRRMLRHKAFIQAARLAFGFKGVSDIHEAEMEQDHSNVVEMGFVDSKYINNQLTNQSYVSDLAKDMAKELIPRIKTNGLEALLKFVPSRLGDYNDIQYVQNELRKAHAKSKNFNYENVDELDNLNA